MLRIAFLLAALVLGTAAADACSYTRGPFLRQLDKWGQTCRHPLCGRIVRTGPPVVLNSQPECSNDPWMALREDIKIAVVTGGSVLFGDVHDNPDHHELHSRMALGTFASFVLEQIRADQYPGLDKIGEVQKSGYDSASLGAVLGALEWEKSGWSKLNYEPLMRALLLTRKPVFAGDPSRESMQSVVRDGKGALLESDAGRLKLDTALGDPLDASSRSELAQAHCGTPAAPESLDKMAFAQRFRDAHMADALLKAIEKHGSAALFAGNAHVRTDRGVPWYLRQRAPERPVVSVMLVEVDPARTDADAYVPRDPEGKPAADYLIFTPASGAKQPCTQSSDK